MSDQPLQPFHPPEGLGINLAVSPAAFLGALLVLVLVFWAIYTLVAIYHWIRFSHAAAVAYPAIFIHLVMSGAFVIYALTGFV